MMDILPAELKELLSLNKPVKIIDVREELEFSTFNIGGKNIPLSKLSLYLKDHSLSENDEIVVVCQRGLRSETARRIFVSAGFKQVKNLKGGLLSYNR